jgi:hypothetical protein
MATRHDVRVGISAERCRLSCLQFAAGTSGERESIASTPRDKPRRAGIFSTPEIVQCCGTLNAPHESLLRGRRWRLNVVEPELRDPTFPTRGLGVAP